MFGTRRYFCKHSCFRKLQFLLLHQFCQFSNFKNLSSPKLALFQWAFSQKFWDFKLCDKSLLSKLFTFEVFETFTFSKSFENFFNRHPGVTKF